MSDAKYIVIDGLDGSGKGDVLKAVEAVFSKTTMIHTREPGGTVLAEKLREILISEKMDPFTEMCLFLGARRETRNLVRGVLNEGISVLSDRSDSSTFAFQICGRQRPHLEKVFWMMSDLIAPRPSLYIFLDLPAEVAQGRLKARGNDGGEISKFDNEEMAFHERVRDGFKKFAQKVQTPCQFVDASQTREVVATEVVNHIRQHLKLR